MSFWDKLLGRDKKTAGDMTGDSSMKSEEMHQEREGMAEEPAAAANETTQGAREETTEHE
jgi:uncharacterized protein YjbJ (UPF0337 family)